MALIHVRTGGIPVLAALLGLGAGMLACEPESVTAARDRLGRGAPGVLDLELPLVQDSFLVTELLDQVPDSDLIETADSLIAFVVQRDQVIAPVFEGLGFEEGRELTRTQINFGDLEAAMDSSTVNRATFELDIASNAAVPVEVSDMTLGIVQLDANGQIPRDGGGNPVYEPGTVTPVTDPGQATLTVPPAGTSVSVSADGLVDRMVHLLLDDVRVALVVAGTSQAAPGFPPLTPGAALTVDLTVVVVLDITIPAAGVGFTRHQIVDGISLDDDDADDLSDRLVLAEATTSADNVTPFGLEISIALAPDSVDPDTDVFALPNAVLLQPILIGAPPVDAGGTAMGVETDTLVVSLSGSDTRVLFNDVYTAAVRFRLLPGAGSGGRGRVRVVDEIRLGGSVRVQIRRGRP